MIFDKIINDIDNQIERMNEELLSQIEIYYDEKEKQNDLLIQGEIAVNEYKLNIAQDESENHIEEINKNKKMIELTIYRLKDLRKELYRENSTNPFLNVKFNW